MRDCRIQFNVDSDRFFLRNFFMAGIFTLGVFVRNLLKRNLQKNKFFSYFVLMPSLQPFIHDYNPFPILMPPMVCVYVTYALQWRRPPHQCGFRTLDLKSFLRQFHLLSEFLQINSYSMLIEMFELGFETRALLC